MDLSAPAFIAARRRASSKKRAGNPQVVEFVDPAKKIREDKRAAKARRTSSSSYEKKKKTNKSDEEDRVNILKSIRALGSVGLKGKEKWKYKNDLIRRMGGKAPKNRKVPFKILLGMRAKEKKRKMWRENEIKQSGVVLGRSNVFESSRDKSKGKKRRKTKSSRFDGITKPSFGHMKGGTLLLGKNFRGLN